MPDGVACESDRVTLATRVSVGGDVNETVSEAVSVRVWCTVKVWPPVADGVAVAPEELALVEVVAETDAEREPLALADTVADTDGEDDGDGDAE